MTVERLLERGGTLIYLFDRARLRRKPEHRGCQIPDAEAADRAAGDRRFCRARVRAGVRGRLRSGQSRAARGRNGGGNRIDVRLERVRTEPRRIGLARELRHVREHVASCVHEVELPLQHRDPGLQRRLIRFRSARQLSSACIDFRLDRRPLVIEPLAQPAQRLLRCGLVRCLLLIGIAAQQLRVGAREVEDQFHDLVCCPGVRIQDQQVARLPRRLLLGAERAIPVHRLVEDLHDLVAGHHGARLCRACLGLSRRVGGMGSEHRDARQDTCCNSCVHGPLL